ncbi:MAG TPA: hypothetical protein VMS08_00375, partial [Candidatus Saccharimonadia bacterium]|nr:hypothetical protein [Candidatus Saccharimonadia bacterium]
INVHIDTIGVATGQRRYGLPVEATTLREAISARDYGTFDLAQPNSAPVAQRGLMLFGGDDDLQLGRQAGIAERCAQILPMADIEIRPKTDHWFTRSEAWLAKRIASWVLQLAH